MTYSAQLAVNAAYTLTGNHIPTPDALLPSASLMLSGNGYLGGDFPDYVTKIEGTPTKTEILVLVHGEMGSDGDGQMVSHIETLDTGSWRVDNLNPDLRYDVVCRYPGYKDEIMSNIKPFVE